MSLRIFPILISYHNGANWVPTDSDWNHYETVNITDTLD